MSSGIVDAATRIRRELAELEPDRADEIGSELDGLLNEIQQNPTDRLLDQVFELLGRTPGTRARLHELLAVDRERSSYGPLEGDPTSDYDRWVCAKCGYAFPVLDADDVPPSACPKDSSALKLHLAGG